MGHNRHKNFGDDEKWTDRGIRESSKRSSRQQTRLMLDDLSRSSDVPKDWNDEQFLNIVEEEDQ